MVFTMLQMKGYVHGMIFACEIFKQADIKINVKPVSSTAFPTKAIRPHNSRMSKKMIWMKQALIDYQHGKML